MLQCLQIRHNLVTDQFVLQDLNMVASSADAFETRLLVDANPEDAVCCRPLLAERQQTQGHCHARSDWQQRYLTTAGETGETEGVQE
jgi:hypothetical protein